MRKATLFAVATTATLLVACVSTDEKDQLGPEPESGTVVSSQTLGANEMFVVAEAKDWPPLLTFCPASTELNIMGNCKSGEALRRAGGESYAIDFMYTPEIVGARSGVFPKYNEQFGVHRYVVSAPEQTYSLAAADGLKRIRAGSGTYSFEARPGTVVILPPAASSQTAEEIEAKVRALVPGARGYEVLTLVEADR